MNIDPVDPVGFDPSTLANSNGSGANLAQDAGFASPDIDAISTSPLAYFGGIVEQLGKSMSAEGQAASLNGADPSHGVGDAIDMLDSIVSMMSLYASNEGASTDGATNGLPNPSSMRALDTNA